MRACACVCLFGLGGCEKNKLNFIQAVKYFLTIYHREKILKNPLLKRMIRSLKKKYGRPIRDDRENVTMDLLLKIAKKIDLKNLLDLCCMAVSIIAF